MQGFHRIIIQGLENINGFIFFVRSATVRPLVVKRAVVRAHLRPPVAPFLFAGIFPVVNAWSFWNKKDKEKETEQQGTEGRSKNSIATPPLRLLNKSDKKLKEDILKADELYETGNESYYEEAYVILMNHVEKFEPEVLWRLGRLTYERSKQQKNNSEKRKLVEEAYDLVFRSMAVDDQNFASHKWMAILLNSLSVFKGIKEQIIASPTVKSHMQKAAELNPEDPTSIYLLGHWCFTIADIPWYQRKLAETIFATPPKCSFEEAYRSFLKAEYTQPGFYSMNLLMLAKCCIKMGDMDKAEEYLWKLKHYKMRTEDDFLAKQEGRTLREKLFKGRTFTKAGEKAANEGKI